MTISIRPEPSLSAVDGAKPGIRRVRKGRGFSYVDQTGRPVRDPEVLARIKSLAVPPAWTNVWISASERARLQATGRDAKGRKQYRYHVSWTAKQGEAKFGRIADFAKHLPALRRRVARDLSRPGFPKEKVVAAIVRLLDVSLIRVGNDEYARTNKSFGLTTMRDGHVTIRGNRIRFRFRGKSGKLHTIEVDDARAAEVVRHCRPLPGRELFRYKCEGGYRTVTSAEVNEYIRAVCGNGFTAKDFRTWTGTVLAATALLARRPAESSAQAKRRIRRAVDEVAVALGNTPSVCRTSYVHPGVIEAYVDASLFRKARPAPRRGLRVDEEFVIHLLEGRRRHRASAAA